MLEPLTSPTLAVRLVEVISSVGICLSSAEYLAQRHLLNDVGFMSWPVSRLRNRLLASRPMSTLFDAFLAFPNVFWIVLLRFVGALVLIVTASGSIPESVRLGLVVLVTLCCLLLSIRDFAGSDGADQMTLLIFVALSIGYAFSCHYLALWFIAMQSLLAYVTSGAAKAMSREWRSGQAMIGIARTRIYGHPVLEKLLGSSPFAGRLFDRATIVMECLFVLVVVLPWPWNGLLLMGGAAFHAGTAVFMGLNTFFWAFVATYPAILFSSTYIQAT